MAQWKNIFTTAAFLSLSHAQMKAVTYADGPFPFLSSYHNWKIVLFVCYTDASLGAPDTLKLQGYENNLKLHAISMEKPLKKNS